MSRLNHSFLDSLKLIEQSVSLFKKNAVLFLSVYYLGTLPFLLALVFFLVDMTMSPLAGRRSLDFSLLVMLLYCWKKWWHRKFCALVMDKIAREKQEKKKTASLCSQLYIQFIP